MGLFDNAGVQMMLKNMLAAAAPELAEHVDSVARMVKEFNDRLISLQMRQQQILEILQRMEAQSERPIQSTDAKSEHTAT
jgi:hypothetical protein